MDTHGTILITKDAWPEQAIADFNSVFSRCAWELQDPKYKEKYPAPEYPDYLSEVVDNATGYLETPNVYAGIHRVASVPIRASEIRFENLTGEFYVLDVVRLLHAVAAKYNIAIQKGAIVEFSSDVDGPDAATYVVWAGGYGETTLHQWHVVSFVKLLQSCPDFIEKSLQDKTLHKELVCDIWASANTEHKERIISTVRTLDSCPKTVETLTCIIGNYAPTQRHE